MNTTFKLHKRKESFNPRLKTDQVVESNIRSIQKHRSYSAREINSYKKKIKQLLKDRNATIVAHYYTDPMIQSLAEETGGIVSDSLEMARFGNSHQASVLVVAGVKFMGETAKILTP